MIWALLFSLSGNITLTPEQMLQMMPDMSQVIPERRPSEDESGQGGGFGDKAILTDGQNFGPTSASDQDLYETISERFPKKRDGQFRQWAVMDEPDLGGSYNRRVWKYTEARQSKPTYQVGTSDAEDWSMEMMLFSDPVKLGGVMTTGLFGDLDADETSQRAVPSGYEGGFAFPQLWYVRTTMDPITEYTTIFFARVIFRYATKLSAWSGAYGAYTTAYGITVESAGDLAVPAYFSMHTQAFQSSGWYGARPQGLWKITAPYLQSGEGHWLGWASPSGTGYWDYRTIYLKVDNQWKKEIWSGVRMTSPDLDLKKWMGIMALGMVETETFAAGGTPWTAQFSKVEDTIKGAYCYAMGDGAQADNPFFFDFEKVLAAGLSDAFGPGRQVSAGEISRFMQMTPGEKTFYLNNVGKQDQDGDGWSDAMETQSGYNANNFFEKPSDQDGDAYLNGHDVDTDGDGSLNSTDSDDDGDGHSDGYEKKSGTRPYDAYDFPDSPEGGGGTPANGKSHGGATGGPGGGQAPLRPVTNTTHAGTTASGGPGHATDFVVQDALTEIPEALRADDPSPIANDAPEGPIELTLDTPNEYTNPEPPEQMPEEAYPYRGELPEANPNPWGPGGPVGPDGTYNDWGYDVAIDNKWITYANSGRGYNTEGEIAAGVASGLETYNGSGSEGTETAPTGLDDGSMSGSVAGMKTGSGVASLVALAPTLPSTYTVTLPFAWVDGSTKYFSLPFKPDTSTTMGAALDAFRLALRTVLGALVFYKFFTSIRPVFTANGGDK